VGEHLVALDCRCNTSPGPDGIHDETLLCVSMFAISINGLVNVVGPSVTTSLCMDDVAIYCCSRTTDNIERRLQGAINRLSRRAQENGFMFSPDKTKCLHFTRLRGLKPDLFLSLRNRVLPFISTCKFLGLILDSKLLGASYEIPTCEMRTVTEYFKSFIWTILGRRPDGYAPTLSYAYPLQDRLWQLHVSLRQEPKLSIIDPVPNTGLCLATGAFRTSRLQSLYAESGEPPLTVRGNLLLCNYVTRLETQPSSLVQSCVPPLLPLQIRFSIIGPSTYQCLASRSPTATRQRVTPQTPTFPTLVYPTPYLWYATYQVRSRRTVSSHVLSLFSGITLTLPGPYSCVYWWVISPSIGRECFCTQRPGPLPPSRF
jgi:hypothetical protein